MNYAEKYQTDHKLDEAAGKSMQKGGRLSHYKKYSKTKKSWQHLASPGKASTEGNRFDKKFC
jgi:hypothetical protein